MRTKLIPVLAVLAVVAAHPAYAGNGRHTAGLVGAGAGLLVGALLGGAFSSPAQAAPQPAQPAPQQVYYYPAPQQQTVVRHVIVRETYAPPQPVVQYYCTYGCPPGR